MLFRSAYVYQFWAEGALQLKGNADTLMQKIADFIQKLLGIGVKQSREADPEEEMQHAFKLFDRGFEVMFIGGEAHLIAAWLYFSCLPGAGKGVWTAFTGSPIMVKMGEYAMHVYLLQYPLAVIMDAAVNGLPADSRPPFTGWVAQLELIVGLWSMSVIFAEVLDKPLQRGLSKMLGDKAK